jgi:hypothetical protein
MNHFAPAVYTQRATMVLHLAAPPYMNANAAKSGQRCASGMLRAVRLDDIGSWRELTVTRRRNRR